jgi:hypothetical protein
MSRYQTISGTEASQYNGGSTSLLVGANQELEVTQGWRFME